MLLKIKLKKKQNRKKKAVRQKKPRRQKMAVMRKKTERKKRRKSQRKRYVFYVCKKSLFKYIHVLGWPDLLNWPDAKWTITLPLIKIQDKQRFFSVHFIWDRKHVYLFVLEFFHRYVILTGQSHLSISFSRRVNYHKVSSKLQPGIYCIDDFFPISKNWASSRENCLPGLRPGKTQTGLLSYRDELESWNFGYRNKRYYTI